MADSMPRTKRAVTDPEILTRIGLVVTTSSFLEAVIEDLIAGFLGTDVQWVYAITAEINMSTRIESLRTLARLRLSPEDFEDFESRLNGAKILVPFRNKIVHGLWTQVALDFCEVAALRARGKLRMQIEYVNSFYLDWLVAQITAATMNLFVFGKVFGLEGFPTDEDLS